MTKLRNFNLKSMNVSEILSQAATDLITKEGDRSGMADLKNISNWALYFSDFKEFIAVAVDTLLYTK